MADAAIGAAAGHDGGLAGQIEEKRSHGRFFLEHKCRAWGVVGQGRRKSLFSLLGENENNNAAYFRRR
jgi:hypothetical protein